MHAKLIKLELDLGIPQVPAPNVGLFGLLNPSYCSSQDNPIQRGDN